jgi:hypothetical protein
MWIDQQLLSLYLPEAIAFDHDVQIEKTRVRWKDIDIKNTLELVSMFEMIAIMP